MAKETVISAALWALWLGKDFTFFFYFTFPQLCPYVNSLGWYQTSSNDRPCLVVVDVVKEPLLRRRLDGIPYAMQCSAIQYNQSLLRQKAAHAETHNKMLRQEEREREVYLPCNS